MSLQIEKGLFKFDFTDHHAILGLPLDADAEEVRQRYKNLARQLHPDRSKAETEEDKQLATQLFAKMVGPAYTKLSNERDRAEYSILVGMMGKRLLQEKAQIKLHSEAAKELVKATDLEATYKRLIQTLAQQQYETLSKSLDMIGQISELNLVYLLRKERQGGGVQRPSTTANQPSASPTNAQTSGSTGGSTATPASPTYPTRKSFVEDYCRRAEELMTHENFSQAILELKEAIKLEPNNSRCFGLLAMVYLNQNQPTPAKVYIKKALQLDPQDPTALAAKNKLENPNPAGGKGKKKEAEGITIFGIQIGGKKPEKTEKTKKKSATSSATKAKSKGKQKEDSGVTIFGIQFGGTKKK